MDYPPFGDYNRQDSSQSTGKGLLGSGWRPLYRQFDLDYFWHLLSNDTVELCKKTLDLSSDLADTLGRKHYSWWANIIHLFSDDIHYDFNEFWEYITPNPSWPDRRYERVLTVETPVTQLITEIVFRSIMSLPDYKKSFYLKFWIF
ncbi:hypothetical protein [Gloeothece citriformis]|uniref:hypothetical protein n=1 Tax=Gloeothece citriformis TaxID=2546356 RepID=UPI00030A2E9F|nr:hypothetical protein [Gloeothece citriformis]